MMRFGIGLVVLAVAGLVASIGLRESRPAPIEELDGAVVDTLAAERLFAQEVPDLGIRGAKRNEAIVVKEGSYSQLRVAAGTLRPYDVQFVLANIRNVKKGEVLGLHLRARVEPGSGAPATVTIAAEAPTRGTPKSVLVETSFPEEWTQVFLPFRVRETGVGGTLRFVMNGGHRAQNIDLSHVEILRYPPSSTPEGLAALQGSVDRDTSWVRQALERIDKHRKANLDVLVVDEYGRPVEGAEVEFAMKAHAFRFGTAINESAFVGRSLDVSDHQKYQEELFRLFNSAVLESNMKWKNWEVPHRRRVADSIVATLTTAGLTMRGHALVWPSWRRSPVPLRRHENNPEVLQSRILSHVREQVSWYRGRIIEWDVVNEPYTNNDLIRRVGIEGVAEWFKTAHAADSSAGLLINDFYLLETGNAPWTHRAERLLGLIRELKAWDAPVTGIGLQSHFDLVKLSEPTTMLATLDSLSSMVEDLVITEYDIDIENEQLAATFTRDFLIAAFSHPAVKGFYIWGFWDGRHWKDNALLYRADWSMKPAGRVWEDLVYSEWWTNAIQASDHTGNARIRGFHGLYTITVAGSNSTVHKDVILGPQGADIRVELNSIAANGSGPDH